MNKRSWTIGLAVGVGIALASGRAAAGHFPFKGSLSATSITTEMDINQDGVKNGLFLGGAKSTLGPSTVQGPAGEFVLSRSVTCPSGYVGLTETPGTGGLVFRFDSTGDLLFEKDTSSTLCFDPVTGLFFGSGAGDITGGTGRFAGATGSFEYTHCTGNTLFFEQPPGDHGFFTDTCEFTGTINTTK